MKDEYIIINKSQIEKRIGELLKYVGNRKPNADEYAKMHIYREILSQSTPLIPIIKNAFYNGGDMKEKEEFDFYISNLKLDI